MILTEEQKEIIRAGCPRCGYPELEVGGFTESIYCPLCYYTDEEWEWTDEGD